MTAEKEKQDTWRNIPDKAGHVEPSRNFPCLSNGVLAADVPDAPIKTAMVIIAALA